jgi:hypothetical protein
LLVTWEFLSSTGGCSQEGLTGDGDTNGLVDSSGGNDDWEAGGDGGGGRGWAVGDGAWAGGDGLDGGHVGGDISDRDGSEEGKGDGGELHLD